MKDEEINIAIAKALNVRFEKRTVCPWCNGNTPYEAGDDYGITIWAECKTCHNTGKVEPYYVGVPNYCNDLNAMHEAEKALLSMDGSCGYWETYSNALTAKMGCVDIFHATARQRAEAFLKTLNLWKGVQQ